MAEGTAKVFIDGSVGTTGLRIRERLSGRDDIELVLLPEEYRKDALARREALNSCDIAFLCLPDDAAREAVSMIENPDVTVIDASTAHRTNPSFAYGFPELSQEHRDKIASSKRIAVPGCHASGFIALVYPLIESGILPDTSKLSCHSLTGYSGGGKKMIEQYESEERDALLGAPRQYGLTQSHKHLPEMQYITGLKHQPVFCPIVADFYSGMEVTVPIFASDLRAGREDIIKVYSEKYSQGLVRYDGGASEEGFLSAGVLSGKDNMTVSVYGGDERIILVARYDNLGKGASGAAVECMNIKLGQNPSFGLDI